MRTLFVVFALAGAPFSLKAQIVQQGGFEAGPYAGIWQESSTNFGTPICRVSVCGTGTGTGPKSGVYWAWFGGSLLIEHGLLAQNVTIPASPGATLEFELEIKVGINPLDFLEVRLDDSLIGRWTADQSPQFQKYVPISIDITPWAGSGVARLEFESLCLGGTFSNFFVDDIRISLSTCYADCEEDGDKDVFDFLCFQSRFAAQDPYADCEHDGDWDVFDFLCFQSAFAACPL